MNKSIVLEICVETLAAATAAERGGANRIELCEGLREGGVTPSAELMRAAREQLKIPVFSMIRPRGGDFCYSNAEFEQMKHDIGSAKAAGLNGVVLGILRDDRRVDMDRTAELVRFAQPLPATFHRAFDEVPEMLEGLERVIATGAVRLLTSAGAATAEAGSRKLRELVKQANGRITVMVGGGIRPENLEEVARATNAREFHSGLSSKLPYPRQDHTEFEAAVREMAGTLARMGDGKSWDRSVVQS